MDMADVKIKLVEDRAKVLYSRLQSCDICPRDCKVNRLKGKKGYCGTAKDIEVYTSFLHHGEEPLISGEKGSGTIFFSGCSLKCIYCQNYKFSHHIKKGKIIDEIELAKIMLSLQSQGAHNINLVTPTHFLPQILRSLLIALKKGLDIPLVYNTSGYEKKEVIEQIEGIIDVYLADLKYASLDTSKAYSKAPNYAKFASLSLLEMHRQSSPLIEQNLLKKGLIVRHLVLPNHIQESKKILGWIKRNLPKALNSVMFQYQPYFKAKNYPKINRPINRSEYTQIKEFVEEIGLKGWVQDFRPDDTLAGPYFDNPC